MFSPITAPPLILGMGMGVLDKAKCSSLVIVQLYHRTVPILNQNIFSGASLLETVDWLAEIFK